MNVLEEFSLKYSEKATKNMFINYKQFIINNLFAELWYFQPIRRPMTAQVYMHFGNYSLHIEKKFKSAAF